MVRRDRLEEIAASRGQDPDIRWLIDEAMRLRDNAEREHQVALDLARVAVTKLNSITSELAELIQLLTR